MRLAPLTGSLTFLSRRSPKKGSLAEGSAFPLPEIKNTLREAFLGRTVLGVRQKTIQTVQTLRLQHVGPRAHLPLGRTTPSVTVNLRL